MMAEPQRSTGSRLPRAAGEAPPRRRMDDVVSIVGTMSSGCEADLRACQELAAAASAAAAGQSAASSAASGDRSAQVRALLDIVHKLERLPRPKTSAPPGAARGRARPGR